MSASGRASGFRAGERSLQKWGLMGIFGFLRKLGDTKEVEIVAIFGGAPRRIAEVRGGLSGRRLEERRGLSAITLSGPGLCS